MTMVLAICVAVTFAVSIYLMLGRELKGIAMGVFLLSHAANLSIIAMSGSPISPPEAAPEASVAAVDEPSGPQEDSGLQPVSLKAPPVLEQKKPLAEPLAQIADPLPQALILTAIVISFGVMAFLLTLIVVTQRKAHTIEITELATTGSEHEAEATKG